MSNKTTKILTDENNHSQKAVNFFNLLEKAIAIYKISGGVPTEIVEEIIGKPPFIPDTPNVDTLVDAYAEMTAYCKEKSNIVKKIATYAKN